MSDQAPSNTAISLYFTASGSQGLGAITGSATAATALVTGQVTTEDGGTSAANTPGESTSKVSGATGNPSSSSTSTSKGGAMPTRVPMEMMGVVAGGVMMVAL